MAPDPKSEQGLATQSVRASSQKQGHVTVEKRASGLGQGQRRKEQGEADAGGGWTVKALVHSQEPGCHLEGSGSRPSTASEGLEQGVGKTVKAPGSARHKGCAPNG